MDDQVTKSVRLQRSLVDKAEGLAEKLGLTFGDIVETALRREFNMEGNPRTDLLRQVAQWLLEQYPDKKGFPSSVTRLVFRHIQEDHAFRSLYDAAITGPDGSTDEGLRWTLHRLVGQTVSRVLNAKVIGRSVELEPGNELIKTHALLEPSN